MNVGANSHIHRVGILRMFTAFVFLWPEIGVDIFSTHLRNVDGEKGWNVEEK